MEIAISLLASLTWVPVWMDAEPTTAPTDRDVVEVAKLYGFTEVEVQNIKDGAILSKDLTETSDKELAGVVGVFLPKPMAELAEILLEGKLLKSDRTIRALHVWKPDESAENAFASLELDTKEYAEVNRFLQPGRGQLNLAGAEIEQFQKLRPRKGTKDLEAMQAVNTELQAILKARYEAYRKNGLKGILPYARGGKKTASPGEEIALAIQSTIPADRWPGYAKALLHYPAAPIAGIEHRFLCYKQNIEDRPAFILSHRSRVREKHTALVTEQRYYVGHTYDCRFIASDCLEVEGGTVMFYVNCTFTDQVAGMGSGLKHNIGRKRMLTGVAADWKRIRQELQK